MKKKLKVVIDCDDVLFDCNKYAVELLNTQSGFHYSKGQITKWGLLGNELDDRLKYFKDPDFVASIPVMEGAHSFVQNLCEIAEVFVATSVPPQCAGARVSAIVRNFPWIPIENILIGNRKDLLAGDVILDDCPDHIKNSCMTYPVLFRQPWNLDMSGVVSVTTYQEFMTLLSIILGDRNDSFQRGTSAIHPLVLIGPSGSRKNQIADSLASTGRFMRVKGYSTRKNGKYTYMPKDDILNSDEFLERSSYMGEVYGTRYQDVQEILELKKIPLLVMDINGGINMKQSFDATLAYVSASKEDCIRQILSRNLPLEESVRRISSIDGETKNSELCDWIVTSAEEIL